jgi:DNA-binding transcriptional LysR family regulator
MISEKGGDFLQWLRGFYFTVKKGGVGAAAQHMGRTQSSVSHQIKCLEEDLGVQLFDRSRRNLELTEEGKKVLTKVIEIFDTVADMEALARPSSQRFVGQLNIVGTHAILLNFLPKFVTSFRLEHPGTSFSLDSGGLDYILNRVSTAEADFGIACPYSLPEHLVFSPLFETTPFLISPKESPWRIPNTPSLSQIAHLPFITFPVGTSIENSVSRQFALKGLFLKTVLLLTHFEHVKSYVEMGMGVSILDAYTLTEHDYQRLRIHRMRDFNEVRVYGIITRKKGYLRPVARSFQDSLQREK